MPKKAPSAHEQRQALRRQHRQTRQARYAAEGAAVRKQQAASVPARAGTARQRYRDRKALARALAGEPVRRTMSRPPPTQIAALYHVALVRLRWAMVQPRLARFHALCRQRAEEPC